MKEERVKKLKANQERLFYTEEKPEKCLNLETGRKRKEKYYTKRVNVVLCK